MSRWRVIITDRESLSVRPTATGVAPECPSARSPGINHDMHPLWTEDEGRWDDTGVYGCCPGPRLECGNEVRARQVKRTLNYFDVEVCS